MSHSNLPDTFFDLIHSAQFQEGRPPRLFGLETRRELGLDQHPEIGLQLLVEVAVNLLPPEQVAPEALQAWDERHRYYSLSCFEGARDGDGDPPPVLGLGVELAPPGPGEPVVLGPAVV